MDFFLAILPIALLVYVMTKKASWPSHISLPLAAALVYFLTLVHFRLDPKLVNASAYCHPTITTHQLWISGVCWAVVARVAGVLLFWEAEPRSGRG